MCPECRRKDWRGKSCWLHPPKSGPEVDQGPGGVTTSPTLLNPLLAMEPTELSEIGKKYDVFQVLLGLLPTSHPRGKARVKMNE